MAQRTIEFRLLVISLPALFWQGYWSPAYALFFGFFWAFAVLKKSKSSQLNP
jgi:fatty acid desaturase